jgi:hypothetical protein
MKAELELSNGSYGFGMVWTLNVSTKAMKKSFFLGQDVKFCMRVLNMEPSAVVDAIGSGDISNQAVRNKLAKFIVKQLGLTAKEVKHLQPWSLSAE